MANQQARCTGVHVEYCGLGVYHLSGDKARVRVVFPGFTRSEDTVLLTGADGSNPREFATTDAALRAAVAECGGHITPDYPSAHTRDLFEHT